MLVTDCVKDFYNKIVLERVLVMVSMDVDALCACKILQALFKCDHVQYTLVPVSNKTDLTREFEEHKDQYKCFVLLNCGGNLDLLDMLDPPEDITFFVIDSHRPIDLVNFYCENQVYFILQHEQDEITSIPEYDSIYRDYDSDEIDSEDDSEQVSKRRRFDEATLERKRERRKWEEKRKEVIFEYEEFSYFGTSAALIVYEIAWKLSKDNSDLLWWAIAGVADQFQNKRTGRDKYVSSVLTLQGHMSRLNHQNEDDENTKSINCLKVNFEHDLDLALYRHWSLFESLCHSLTTSTTFKVWTNIGMKRLHQFLAEMGIPLTQCKQNYAFMDTKMRENLQSLVEESAEKFGLRDMKYQSFSAQYGFNHKLCASDAVYSVGALLEDINGTTDNNLPEDNSNFVGALESLSRITAPKMKEGLNLAKLQLKSIKSNVSSFIDIGQVMSYGPFLYTSVQEGTPDYKYFGQPIFLNLFSHYLLHSYMKSLSKLKREKARNLPLVICAPHNIEEQSTIIIGIPPLADETRKNLFGNAFLHAAERTKSRTLHDNFDTSIITIKNEDKSRFMDALITIMS